MDDWLRNMGDWNISRRRYFGLPLPFYPCECGQLNVVGSRRSSASAPPRASTGSRSSIGPGSTRSRSRASSAAATCGGVAEVGDAWLDAGIVPFATLGWQNDEFPGRLRDGRRRGAHRADLPDHAYWEKWFPADWVSEMREQIRLWFYSQSFMSVTSTAGLRTSRS